MFPEKKTAWLYSNEACKPGNNFCAIKRFSENKRISNQVTGTLYINRNYNFFRRQILSKSSQWF
jgi:hypothetical protein